MFSVHFMHASMNVLDILKIIINLFVY